MSNIPTVRSLIENGTSVPDDLYVLTREGLAELTKEIFKNVNYRITDRIVNDINDTSDEHHVPSAETVYNAMKNLSQIKTLTISSGNINEAAITPDQNTLYVVRKSVSDTKAVLYIWTQSVGYIAIAGGEGGALNTTVNAIPNDVIADIVASSYQETDPGINVSSLDLEDE